MMWKWKQKRQKRLFFMKVKAEAVNMKWMEAEAKAVKKLLEAEAEAIKSPAYTASFTLVFDFEA